MRSRLKPSLVVALILLPSIGRAEDFGAPGPYPVGVHRTRIEVADFDPGRGPRVLETVVWYPADALAPGAAAVGDADVARGRFPLIVFSHGVCGRPDYASLYTAGLAAFDYVVVAPSHPGSFGPDDCRDAAGVVDSFVHRVVEVQGAADWMLARSRDPASRFHRHVDPRRLGVTGRSYGGQTTLRTLAADARFRAGVALQPAPITEITIPRPLLVIGAERDTIVPFETSSRSAFALATGRAPWSRSCAPGTVPWPTPAATRASRTASIKPSRAGSGFAMRCRSSARTWTASDPLLPSCCHRRIPAMP